MSQATVMNDRGTDWLLLSCGLGLLAYGAGLFLINLRAPAGSLLPSWCSLEITGYWPSPLLIFCGLQLVFTGCTPTPMPGAHGDEDFRTDGGYCERDDTLT
jgi:hypothetical protein